MMFKTGDRVRCKDPHGAYPLKVGEVYTVEAITEDGKLELLGLPSVYDERRFETAPSVFLRRRKR